MLSMDESYRRMREQEENGAMNYIVTSTPPVARVDVVNNARELVDAGVIIFTQLRQVEVTGEEEHACCDDEEYQ